MPISWTSPFQPSRNSIVSCCKTLRKEGIGCEAKHAETISKEEESRLWDKGVLNVTSPKGLLRAVFYYNFCLHGGSEHRDLKLSQFMRLDGHYLYTENSSKTTRVDCHSYGLRTSMLPSLEMRMLVRDVTSSYILDTYISKLPEEVKQNDFFYARSLMKPHPDELWYATVPVGKNMLSTIDQEHVLRGKYSRPQDQLFSPSNRCIRTFGSRRT